MQSRGRIDRVQLELARPFTIAHGSSTHRDTVIVEIDGGAGEAAIVPYMGEGTAEVVAAIERLLPQVGQDARSVEDPHLPVRIESRAATCALDMALLDRAGKAMGRPLWDLVGLREPEPVETSVTIAMDTPDRMVSQVRETPASIYKVKVGGYNDEESVEAIRGATNARLRLDVNGGWTRERAAELLPRLKRFDIELVEQPLPPAEDNALGWLKAQDYGIPIFVDESVSRVDDIARVAPGVDGIVVKLRKLGGVRAAIEAVHLARRCGLHVMISCMIESSLAVTAAAHLAQLCDLVDLDAPLLIRNDPYLGVTYQGSRCSIPSGSGIGAIRRNA